MPSLIKFSANAQKIAQNYIRTLGTPSIGSTYLHTINGKVFTYLAASAVAATEATALAAAFNSQTDIPELQEWTASISATGAANILFLSKTSGLPGIIAFTTGGAGAPSYAAVSAVANSSPADVSQAPNYSGGVLPAAGDSFFLENLTTDLLYGLGYGAAILLPLIEVARSFTGNVGLTEFVSNNRYREYRTPRYLAWLVTNLNIGTGPGTGRGSNRLMFNLGATATKINVFASGNGVAGLPAVQLLAVNAANTLVATNGTVGIAINSDEVSTFGTVTLTDEGGSVSLIAGPGLTLTNLTMIGARVDVVMAVSPINVSMQAIGKGSGGTLLIRSGNITTLVIDAGTLTYRGTGSAATMGSVANPVVLGEKATLDLSEGDGTVTIANGLSMRAGSSLIDPRNRLTGTTITFVGCSPDEVTITRGQNSTLAVP